MMSQIEKTIDEKMVQMGLADHLSRLGWVWAEDETLGRPFESVFLTDDVTNALLASVLGFASALSGGLLSDRFRTDDPTTKANICIASSLFASPFIIATFLN